MDVCLKCGLPKDLCVCETIAMGQQKIEVSQIKRKFGKNITLIEGLDPKRIDIEKLTKALKQKLACGGTTKEGVIELQGRHGNRVLEILIEQGFPKESIETK